MGPAEPVEIWELLVREAVRDTLARYHFAGDRGRLDELAACFHDDGRLEIAGQPALVGRPAIVSGLTGTLSDRADERPAGATLTYLHHHLATTHFRAVGPTEVRTSSYFAAMTDIGLDHWGRYADVLTPAGPPDARAEREWLFQRRAVTVDGYAADSRFGR